MKGNLLIIDDEKLLAKNLEQLLRKHADKIFIAHDGHEGLKVLAENEIHCVICDIYMPTMTGLTIIKEVRGSGNNVPFIFFTAYGSDEIKLEAGKYDKTLFLLKPEIKELSLIVKKTLQLGKELE